MTKMVGANYMGGKRNTARAKSKDVVGRAQRRHFGKQRLASALCVTQENHLHSTSAPTPSFPPEIVLAHARQDATMDSCVTSSRKATSGDRLYLSRSPSSPTHKPSKFLVTLDTSDHVSMRAAIDRILKQPTLVGINAQMPRETAHVERMHTPMVVRRSTQARLASKDLDVRETVSKHAFDPPVICPETPRREHKCLHEPNPVWGYWPVEDGVLSPSNAPSGIRVVASWNTVDDSVHARAQLLTGVSPFFHTQGNEPDGSNTFPDSVYPLPRSSPFPPSSQSSDNSILNLDTPPLVAIQLRRPDDDNCMDTTKLHPIPRPTSRQSSQSSFVGEGSAGEDEAQPTISLSTNSDKGELEAEGSRTTCCNNNLASPSTTNNDAGNSFPPGRDTIQVFATREATKDDTPSRNLIDFLSDPHPWETIGRILKLNPPGPSVAQSTTICFTKDREGVGYVSFERSDACNASSSDATSVEAKMNGDSTDDIHIVSDVVPPILEMVGSEGPNIDDRMAMDTHEQPCVNNSIQPLFDVGSPSTTPGEVGPCTHVHALQEAPLLPVIHCTQNEHNRSSPPPITIVGITTAEPEVDMMYVGPCLFGDSDLEDDE